MDMDRIEEQGRSFTELRALILQTMTDLKNAVETLSKENQKQSLEIALIKQQMVLYSSVVAFAMSIAFQVVMTVIKQ